MGYDFQLDLVFAQHAKESCDEHQKIKNWILFFRIMLDDVKNSLLNILYKPVGMLGLIYQNNS